MKRMVRQGRGCKRLITGFLGGNGGALCLQLVVRKEGFEVLRHRAEIVDWMFVCNSGVQFVTEVRGL